MNRRTALTSLFAFAASAAAKAQTSPATVKVKRKPEDAAWKEYPVRTVDALPGFKPTGVARDRFGGRADRKGAKATGFFHPEKAGDRWYLVDPAGNLFLHVGVVSLTPGKTAANKAAIAARYGTLDRWAEQVGGELKRSGFNGAGCWSEVAALRGAKERLVYTVIANMGAPGADYRGGYMHAFGREKGVTTPGSGHANYRGDCIPVFHPDFEAFCDKNAASIAAFKDDPYLLGYFSDNELPLPRLDKYLALKADDPAMGSSYKAARDWWDARKGQKDAPTTGIADADQEAWTEFVFDRYFAVTTKAIRKHDPNHLCLGCRFHGAVNRSEGAFKAAGRHLDVVSVNLYGVWEPKGKNVTRWTEWSDKPVVITEWYAKGMDSGFPNTGGAGWVVPTQADRGLFYQTFTLGLLEAKNVVGWHWFKYMDNAPNDRSADPSNRDSNKGIVNVRYEPYPPLLARMAELNAQVYPLADYFDRTGLR